MNSRFCLYVLCFEHLTPNLVIIFEYVCNQSYLIKLLAICNYNALVLVLYKRRYSGIDQVLTLTGRPSAQPNPESRDFLRPMLARSAQHQVDYCHTNSVCPSVCPSVTMLGSVETVRDI